MRSSSENPSSEQVEANVLRRLRGELDAAETARLEQLLARDAKLAKGAAALERAWSDLELPPYAGASVAPQVLARLRAEQRSAAPAWARLAAAAALAAGVGLGLVLDRGLDRPAGGETAEIVETGAAVLFGDEENLAGESLWLAAEADWLDEGEIQ